MNIIPTNWFVDAHSFKLLQSLKTARESIILQITPACVSQSLRPQPPSTIQVHALRRSAKCCNSPVHHSMRRTHSPHGRRTTQILKPTQSFGRHLARHPSPKTHPRSDLSRDLGKLLLDVVLVSPRLLELQSQPVPLRRNLVDLPSDTVAFFSQKPALLVTDPVRTVRPQPDLTKSV